MLRIFPFLLLPQKLVFFFARRTPAGWRQHNNAAQRSQIPNPRSRFELENRCLPLSPLRSVSAVPLSFFARQSSSLVLLFVASCESCFVVEALPRFRFWLRSLAVFVELENRASERLEPTPDEFFPSVCEIAVCCQHGCCNLVLSTLESKKMERIEH